ncbi:LysR family transcriptional regulator [Comamonas serinivorans]|nr:LysR family transcriptional regulator [Comamonas serinivorans]
MRDDAHLMRLLARLRFRHLQMLVALRDCVTLSAAASQMNLSQSALSKMLHEVETAFGFALFERAPKGLVPTERGALVMQLATWMLNELGHATEQLAREAQHSILRLGTPPFIAQAHLPPVIEHLLLHHPCELRLTESGVPRLFDLLQQGRLDALLTSLPSRSTLQRAGVQAQALFTSAMTVIAPRHHALATARPARFAELRAERWIVPAESTLGRSAFEDMFRRAGVFAPDRLVISNSPATNVELVAAGVGLSFVPSLSLARATSATRVREVTLEAPLPASTVALVYRRESDAIQWLRDSIQAQAGDS